jgi:type IV secretory pathway VirB10-like protein
MASRLDNISRLFSNFRTRSIIIVTMVIIGLTILIGIIRLVKSSGDTNVSSAGLASAPTQNTVPGLNPTTPEYTQLQQQLNQQRVQQAEQSGGSAISTLTYQQGTDDTQPAPYVTADQITSPTPTGSPDNEINPQVQALQQQVAMQNQQLQQITAQQVQQTAMDQSGAMRAQAQQLLQAWAQSPTQSYQVTTTAEGKNATNAIGSNGLPGQEDGNLSQTPVLIKAGDIQFAVLDTAINSDEPGPVMATIVMGPYKGAKLLGSLGSAKALPGTNGAEAVVIRFNIMSIASMNNSVGISAVAIDPDTARTALASDVDHHYLLRYGSLFASSFLEGYGDAAQQAGSSVTQNSDGGVFTSYPDADPRREVASGFGQLGQSWGQQLGQTFNRPNTITVNAGIGMGILFLSDATANASITTKTQQAIALKQKQDEIAAENVNTAATSPIAQAQNQLVQTAATDIQDEQ